MRDVYEAIGLVVWVVCILIVVFIFNNIDLLNDWLTNLFK